jgi:hypothetical protein
MKIFLYFLLPLTLAACCLGNRKCAQDNNSVSLRLLDKTDGKDLVFGASKKYDKAFIKFYSLNGTDTISHNYGAGANPNPGQDSLLFVTFDFSKKETVFIRLTNTDIDTLKLFYETIDASPCCEDFKSVKPISLNNNNTEQLTGGITILKK